VVCGETAFANEYASYWQAVCAREMSRRERRGRCDAMPSSTARRACPLRACGIGWWSVCAVRQAPGEGGSVSARRTLKKEAKPLKQLSNMICVGLYRRVTL